MMVLSHDDCGGDDDEHDGVDGDVDDGMVADDGVVLSHDGDCGSGE